MKLAFVAPDSPRFLDQAYLHHLQWVWEQLLEEGHEITVFSIVMQGESTIAPSLGIDVVQVPMPEQEVQCAYLCHGQVWSDALAQRVLQYLENESLDAIEIPLFGGLAFSLVRIKRLLGLVSECKLVLNAMDVPQHEAEIVDLESLMLHEMEAYCLRHADLRCTPFVSVAEDLRKGFGPLQVTVIDAPALGEFVDTCAASESGGSAARLRERLEQGRENESPMQPGALFELQPPKCYERMLKPASLSVLAWDSDSRDLEGFRASMASVSGVEIRWISLGNRSEAELEDSSSNAGLKSAWEHWESSENPLTLEAVLAKVDTDFLIIIRNGIRPESGFVEQAISCMQLHGELAAVGAYAKGSLSSYPIIAIPGMMALHNTCSLWGNLFRVDVLRRLQMEDLYLKAEDSDTSLLLALMERYQLVDVLPFTGLDYSQVAEVNYESQHDAAGMLERMERYSRLWKTHAVRLLKVWISDHARIQSSFKLQRTPEFAWLETQLKARVAITTSKPEEHSMQQSESPEFLETPEPDLAVTPCDAIAMDESSADSWVVEGETLQESGDSERTDNRIQSLEDAVESRDWNEPEESSPWDSSHLDVDRLESIPMPGESEHSGGMDAGLRLDEESEQSFLSAQESIAGVESENPPLRLKKPPLDSSASVDATTLQDRFQVFWSDSKAFSEERSLVQSYDAGTTSSLEFQVDADCPVSHLRVDPSDRSGRLCLRRIEIWNRSTQQLIFETSEENAFEDLVPMGDLEVEGIERDTLWMSATARDPQLLMELGGAFTNPFSVRIEFEFSPDS